MENGKSVIRVLFILNANTGGATQGIKEFINSVPTGKIKVYLILPAQPESELISWIYRNGIQYKVSPLVWWNLNTTWPWYFRL